MKGDVMSNETVTITINLDTAIRALGALRAVVPVGGGSDELLAASDMGNALATAGVYTDALIRATEDEANHVCQKIIAAYINQIEG
jgi:hypothetical protein